MPKSRTSNRSKASNRSLFFTANTMLHDIRNVRMFFKHRNYKDEKENEVEQDASKMLTVWKKPRRLITTLQVKLFEVMHFFFHVYTLDLCGLLSPSQHSTKVKSKFCTKCCDQSRCLVSDVASVQLHKPPPRFCLFVIMLRYCCLV